MPLASFGQTSDPSSVFATLAAGVEDQIRVLADRLDDRREAELAGQDEEFFARYQAGKVSDDEWLDYIRRRKAQTGYDPEQQANWAKAELEWTESIADDRAQAAFERTGEYGPYIEYLQGKLGRTKDSDGRLELTKQIRDLKDGLAQQTLQAGAQRIADRISRNKATQADLLAFYKDQRRNLRRGSPLIGTIDDQIAQLQTSIRAQDFEDRLGRINLDLSTQQISPAEAGKRMEALIKGSDLQQTDPNRYYTALDTAAKLVHSPDPGELESLNYRLSTGAITPSEYETAMYRIADRVAPYDMATALGIKSQAFGNVQQATGRSTTNELSDPGRMQVGPGGVSFQWISQMDGTQYASTNCTMASGAMLAYAMGYKGLSGGDLRYLTGDTVGGTNITQLYNALNRAGVDTSGMSLVNGGTLEKFKRMLGNGRSSVIVGSNANIPASAKASASMNGLHAWLVADYDPKRDAFLVYNSAMSRSDKRSKDGYWVSSDVMQAFAFGPGTSHSWLAAPQGTAGKQRKAWHVIDVDTPPQRKGTPKSYVGMNNKGISGSQRGATRATGQETPLTDDNAKALMDRYKGQLDQTNELLDAYNRGETDWNGQPLDDEIIKAVNEDQLDLYDESIAFADDNDLTADRATLREGRGRLISNIRTRNGLQTVQQFNTLQRDAADAFALLQFDNDPDSRARKVDLWANLIGAFNAATQAQQSDVGSSIDPEDAAAIDAIANGWKTAADPSADLQSKRDALADLADATKKSNVSVTLPGDFTGEGTSKGDANGRGLANAAGLTEDKRKLDSGEGVQVVIPFYDKERRTWASRLEVVPVTGEVRTKTMPDGSTVEFPVPDLSGFPDVNQGVDSMAWTAKPGKGGIQVVMIASVKSDGMRHLQANADDPTGQNRWKKGQMLDDATLNRISPRERQVMIDRGVLVASTESVDRIVTLGNMNPDGSYEVGQSYVRDDGLGGGDVGSGQWYVDRLPIDGGSNPIDGLDFVGVDQTGRSQVTFQPINGYDVVPSAGASPDALQKMMDEGKLDPFRPDPAGRVWRDPAGDDSGTVYWTPVRRAVYAAESAWQAYKQDRAEDAVKQAQEAARNAIDGRPMPPPATDPNVIQPAPGFFDAGKAAQQAMDLAAQFGVRTPHAVNPVTGRKSLADSLTPKPQPSRGDIPRQQAKLPPPPVGRDSTNVRVPERKAEPKPQKRWVPPPPPAVSAAQKAQANAAAAKAKEAAAKAAAAVGTGGGIFGRRAV